MARKRPGALTAAAVMCIIYGSLGCLCGLFGLLGLVMQSTNAGMFNDPQQRQVLDFIEREVPGYQIANAANTLSSLFEAVAILLAGIGLLNMKSWARLIGIIGLIWALVRSVGFNIYQFALVLPAMNRFFQEVFPQRAGVGGPEQKIIQTAMTVGIILQGIFALGVMIYQIITLILISKGSVRQAIQDAAYPAEDRYEGDRYPRGDGRPQDDYDDGWEDRRPPAGGGDPKDDHYR